MGKASDTGGAKPMTIQGRLMKARERLIGMTEEERAFRAKFVKAQILAPDEPRVVPEMYKEFNNPIKRFYKYPLNQLEKLIEPKVGPSLANYIRYFTGKAFLGLGLIYYTAYLVKYNSHDWTRKGGWKITTSREAVLPGDPGYPMVSDKTKPSDYASKGFEKITLNL